MPLEPKLAEALINSEHRILGRKLRPFCLWHLALLQTLDSPYLAAGKVEPFDLRTAVGVCSLHYGQSKVIRPLAFITSRSVTRFEQASNKFLAYIGDYLQRPEYTIVEPDRRGSGTPLGPPPEVLQIVDDVMFQRNITERQAWEMPIGLAYWYQAMTVKRVYNTDFMTPEEKEYQRKLKEHLAKKANGT